MSRPFRALLVGVNDRKSLSALRGVGPEFEAGSGCFHAQMVLDRGLRVKRPPLRDAGPAPHHVTVGVGSGSVLHIDLFGLEGSCRSCLGWRFKRELLSGISPDYEHGDDVLGFIPKPENSSCRGRIPTAKLICDQSQTNEFPNKPDPALSGTPETFDCRRRRGLPSSSTSHPA